MIVRIRDFFITKQNWIFSVVSYDLGEEEVKCLLRYIPDDRGERVAERGRYRKLDFYEAYVFLGRHCPTYVKGGMQVVPKEDIIEILRPDDKLPLIAEREEQAQTIFELLGNRIQRDRIGITGSYLCDLNSDNSDLDFVLYGLPNFNIAREVIEAAVEEGILVEINDAVWRRIYNKRQPELSYNRFVAHEQRKKNRGAIGDTYLDILYTRDREEIKQLDMRNYEIGERIGYAKITAEVKDASFSFDNPAIYEIEHPEISKVLS
ncbi:MAG: DNA polymerase subunit beta, partial [Euryarchaeota archaeon]|nr:DNA polymerase subunit beta [Euryarchaeota archaeon]